MFHFRTRGTFAYLQSDALDRFGFLSHAFCTRLGGTSPAPFSSLNVSVRLGDRPENVRRNREIISETFDFPDERLILAHQVHGDDLLILTEKDSIAPGTVPACDGFITDRPGWVLCVKTADCVPVLIADGKRKVVCAVHAGWRGTALGIAEKAVGIFRERFSADPRDLWAAIGPAIGACCYEVDGKVRSEFADSGRFGSFFIPSDKKDRWMLDVTAANRIQLEEAGIPSGQVTSADLCTSCRRDAFFSHRREGAVTGRQLNFILIREG